MIINNKHVDEILIKNKENNDIVAIISDTTQMLKDNNKIEFISFNNKNQKHSMEELDRCFNYAIQYDSKYIGVKIQVCDNPDPEIIINTRKNFASKLEYYKKAYNDDLTLKANKDIKIVGFYHCDDFELLK